MQILETGENDYTFFCRWGRVGVTGQISEIKASNLNDAIQNYELKLK
jgi:predicted DNA-binding WGR domain protein